LGEVEIKVVPQTVPFKLKRIANSDYDRSRPAQVSLGAHVEGVAMPHPDCHDAPTSLHGAKCRFLAEMPAPNEALMQEFQIFVQNWLETNLVPLTEVGDFEDWVANINHPEWRKQEFRECWPPEDRILRPKDVQVKAHPKDEVYGEYKATRWINARTDRFKCYAGRFVRAVEKALYKTEWFIKNVPVADRPKVIHEDLYRGPSPAVATDYTTYEAVFKKRMLECCEFALFRHMLKFVPEGPEFCAIYEEVIGGLNHIINKFFTIIVEAIRMSGEMSTSLGNGFTNLMLMLFLCKRANCTEVKAKVEGDDGIMTCRGTPPTTEDFAMMGCKIKLVRHTSLSTASFCGIVYHPDDFINLVDFRETIASVGWCSERYARTKPKIKAMLLRCKALSLAHQYPGCPVICALARYLLKCTRHVRNFIPSYLEKQGSRMFNLWEREQILQAVSDMPSDERKIIWREPGIQTRMLAEELYGVSMITQLAVEQYLDSLTTIQPLKLPMLMDDFHPTWISYWDNYVVNEYVQLCDRPILRRSRPRWDLAGHYGPVL